MSAVQNAKQNKLKNFFVTLGDKLKTLKPLVLMQLKDKVDFSFLKSKKKTLFKVVYTLLMFIGLTALVTIAFKLIISLGLFSFVRTFNFRVYLVLMMLLFVLSFLSCLVNVTHTLYFSKDNPVLLTFPVGNGMIFTSKLIVCFVYELIKNATYILPFFIAYGIVMGLSFTYFIWIILSLLFFTLLCVSVAGLLSVPAMWIAILFKKHKPLEIITVLAVITLLVYGVIYVINLIPEDIDLIRDWGQIFWSIQDFLSSFSIMFYPFNALLQLFTGMVYGSFAFNPFTIQNLLTFLDCLCVVAVSFLFIYFVSKSLFLKMASNPFEYKKKVIKKQKKNFLHRPFSSASFKNAQIVFRTSNLIYSIVAIAIIMPIAVFLENKIIAAMDTRSLGNFMGITFNILIVLLISLSSNTVIASTFSKEGNSAYLNKVNPTEYKIPLSAKLVLNALLCVASIVVSTVIIAVFSKMSVLTGILLGVSLVSVYLAHLFWSAELDIMNPQNRLYQTTGSQARNPNETKSTILAFAISAIFAFVCFFLLKENPAVVYWKVLFLSLALLVTRTYLYLTRIKLYYKEK